VHIYDSAYTHTTFLIKLDKHVVLLLLFILF